MKTKNIELWLLDRNNIDFRFIDLLTSNQKLRFQTLSGDRQNEFGITRILLNHIITQKLRICDIPKSEQAVASNNTLHSHEPGYSHELIECLVPVESRERNNLPPDIPIFTNNGGLFSISHSASMIAVAVAHVNQPQTRHKHEQKPNFLGVDIECLNNHRSLKAASFFCNKSQLNKLNRFENDQQKFKYYTRLWTQKEAYFKARHQPVLNTNLKSLRFRQQTQQYDCQSTEWKPDKHQNYQLSIFHNWQASITIIPATLNKDGEINCEQMCCEHSWETFESEL